MVASLKLSAMFDFLNTAGVFATPPLAEEEQTLPSKPLSPAVLEAVQRAMTQPNTTGAETLERFAYKYN